MSINPKPLKADQSGLVSIIVGISFVIIIALIVTSFALLSRRESRQALDRQLSTQAFYAAETGVSDAIEKIKAGNTSLTDCSTTQSLNAGQNDLGNELSYTCVLVNSTPKDLKVEQSSAGKTLRIEAASPIAKIRISWQDKEGSTGFAPVGLPLLPQSNLTAGNPSGTGLIRASLIPVSGNLSRQSLINDTQTLFLYPFGDTASGNVGSVAYASGQNTQGSFVSGNCHTGNDGSTLPAFCNVEITGLPGITQYFLRMRSLYHDSNVTIQAFDGGGNALPLLNSQAVIDSTGKANDVLRRIQVRVPVNTDYITPDFALQVSDGICKKISVTTSVIDACTY